MKKYRFLEMLKNDIFGNVEKTRSLKTQNEIVENAKRDFWKC